MVVELFVSNLKQSSEFYLNFGFTVPQQEGSRMRLKRQDAELYLMETEKAPPLSDRPVGRLRLEVSNVDDYWIQVQRLGIPVYEALEERDSGIRDFTVTGPDGLGLQFVSTISK
jgi:hypothetical protein